MVASKKLESATEKAIVARHHEVVAQEAAAIQKVNDDFIKLFIEIRRRHEAAIKTALAHLKATGYWSRVISRKVHISGEKAPRHVKLYDLNVNPGRADLIAYYLSPRGEVYVSTPYGHTAAEWRVLSIDAEYEGQRKMALHEHNKKQSNDPFWQKGPRPFWWIDKIHEALEAVCPAE